jgi:hypothetical protein
MRWVFDKAFVGVDRRRERAPLRLRERRSGASAGPPPPLPTALRQLKLASFDIDDAALLKFGYHANSVAMLAIACGRDDVAAPLLALLAALPETRRGDARDAMLAAALLRAESNFHDAGEAE